MNYEVAMALTKWKYTKFSRAKFEEIVCRHYKNVKRDLRKEENINLSLYYSNNKHIATWHKKGAWMEVIQ